MSLADTFEMLVERLTIIEMQVQTMAINQCNSNDFGRSPVTVLVDGRPLVVNKCNKEGDAMYHGVAVTIDNIDMLFNVQPPTYVREAVTESPSCDDSRKFIDLARSLFGDSYRDFIRYVDCGFAITCRDEDPLKDLRVRDCGASSTNDSDVYTYAIAHFLSDKGLVDSIDNEYEVVFYFDDVASRFSGGLDIYSLVQDRVIPLCSELNICPTSITVHRYRNKTSRLMEMIMSNRMDIPSCRQTCRDIQRACEQTIKTFKKRRNQSNHDMPFYVDAPLSQYEDLRNRLQRLM